MEFLSLYCKGWPQHSQSTISTMALFTLFVGDKISIKVRKSFFLTLYYKKLMFIFKISANFFNRIHIVPNNFCWITITWRGSRLWKIHRFEFRLVARPISEFIKKIIIILCLFLMYGIRKEKTCYIKYLFRISVLFSYRIITIQLILNY